RALFNHNADQIIARSSAGTLSLDVDDVGLKFKAKIPNTSYGRDLLENLRNGNINQSSFGFKLVDNGDRIKFDEERSIYKRTLNKISEIHDVYVVKYPSYKDTDVAPALGSIDRIREENKAKEKRNREIKKLKLELELG